MNTYFAVFGYTFTLDEVLDREGRYMELMDYLDSPYAPSVEINVLSPYA